MPRGCPLRSGYSARSPVDRTGRRDIALDRSSAASRASHLSRTAVDHQRGLSSRVAALLPVHLMTVPDIHQALLVRVDRRVELGHAMRYLAGPAP